MINHCDIHITLLYVYHSDLSRYVSDYCISITKKSYTSIAVIYHAMSLTVLYGMINHCDRPITLLSDTDTVVRGMA
jgi:hypothetical protein